MSSGRLVRVLLVSTGLCMLGGAHAWAQDDAGDIVITDPRLTESSALALSPLDPELLYTVNDSGHDPLVFVVDRADGAVVGTTALAGVDPDGADTEAVAVDRDGMLWVADVGDNLRSRDDVALYALPAPGPGDTTVTPDRYPVRYPDGHADVETLLADPVTGRMWVVTKGIVSGAVLAVPADAVPGRDNLLVPVDARIPGLVTDGTVLPDGSAVVLRTPLRAFVYRLPDWEPVAVFELPRQQQGESLAALPDGRALLAGSEGSPALIARVEIPADVLQELRGRPAADRRRRRHGHRQRRQHRRQLRRRTPRPAAACRRRGRGRRRRRRGAGAAPAQPSRSTTQSTQAVSASTSAGSTAGNIATRSWLRPSLR